MMADVSQYGVDLSAFNFLQYPDEASLHLSRLHSSTVSTEEKSLHQKSKEPNSMDVTF